MDFLISECIPLKMTHKLSRFPCSIHKRELLLYASCIYSSVHSLWKTVAKHGNEQKNIQKDKSRKFIFSRHSFDVMLVVRGIEYKFKGIIKKKLFLLHERHPQLTVQFNIILGARTHSTLHCYPFFWYSPGVYDAFTSV